MRWVRRIAMVRSWMSLGDTAINESETMGDRCFKISVYESMRSDGPRSGHGMGSEWDSWNVMDGVSKQAWS